jgi:hypothetical protein
MTGKVSIVHFTSLKTDSLERSEVVYFVIARSPRLWRAMKPKLRGTKQTVKEKDGISSLRSQ